MPSTRPWEAALSFTVPSKIALLPAGLQKGPGKTALASSVSREIALPTAGFQKGLKGRR